MLSGLILYTTDAGQYRQVLREFGGQVWLTRLQIAGLYQTSKHVKAIWTDGELAEGSAVNAKLTTAAELVAKRSDPAKPNMNLSSFRGSRVGKADVVIAKNSLYADDLEKLQQRLQQKRKDNK